VRVWGGRGGRVGAPPGYPLEWDHRVDLADICKESFHE